MLGVMKTHACIYAYAGLRLGDLEACLLLGVSARKRSQVLAGLPEHVAQAALETVEGEMMWEMVPGRRGENRHCVQQC